MSSGYNTKLQTKPLKGGSANFVSAQIDNINASSLKLESLNVAGVFEDGIFMNVTIEDSTFINSVIGAEGSPNAGWFTTITSYGDVTFQSDTPGAVLTWDSSVGTLLLTSDMRVEGCSRLGNIRICNNDIYAVNLNGDVNLISNGLGTINLSGQVYNYATVGNWTSILTNGGMSYNVKNDIKLSSSAGSSTISTFDDQTYSTINGDITLQTEDINPINILSINTTLGNTKTIITTAAYNYLKSGDVIEINNTNNSLVDGYFTVGNILSSVSFQLTTTVPANHITTGTMIKSLSNNIILNTQNLVKLPENTKLTFGPTCNYISGDDENLYINSCTEGNLYINTNKIQIPENTHIQFGSGSSNYINYTSGSLNIESSDIISLNSMITQINSTNTTFADPILTIADYTTFDLKDRGIEYHYYNSSGSYKLGWFGYKSSTDKFTFIPDAINDDEIISGIPGKFEIGEISSDNIEINGNITMHCGEIYNVSTINGCSGVLNLEGYNLVNISAGNRISLLAGNDIYIPNNKYITIGTAGTSIIENTASNLILTSNKNILMNTQTNGSIIIPTNTSISFDGSSIGSQKIKSDTSGNLLISTNKNLYLTTTNGNIILPQNTNIQFGNSTETIYGNTRGITIMTSSTNGTFDFISNSKANIISSFGNILLKTGMGDIDLYSTNGNIRLLQGTGIIFNISGTNNSISTNTNANLIINGNNTNSINLQNANNINLSPNNNINIPTNVYLNLSSDHSKYIISDTLSNLYIYNSTGSTFISSINTNLSSSNLNISNINTDISTNSFIITGNSSSTTLINTQNVKLLDPILSLANYSSIDSKDRGIEYNYYSSGSTHLGWFGWKQSTGRFTYYSDAINNNEIITGTTGQFELGSAMISDDITFINPGTIDMNCGIIYNVNTITGCSGTIDIIGNVDNPSSGNVNISAGNISLSATKNVLLSYDTPLSFGNTANSIHSDSLGNMMITSLNGNGTVIFNSNVQINGTTENVFSTVTNYKDPILSIGGVTGPIVNDLKDRGIEFKWNNGTIGNTGFFGFQNSTKRFVFYSEDTNNNEIISGTLGNVQFGNGFFNNIDLAGGTISNVNTLVNTQSLNLISNNINLSSGNVLLPYKSYLSFGDTVNSINADTSGNLYINSKLNTEITSDIGGIIFDGDFVSFPTNKYIYIGDTSASIIRATDGSLNIIDNKAISLSSGNINIPDYSYLNFGNSTKCSILSDSQNLILNGFSSVSINTSTSSFSGNVNIVGTLSASNIDFDLNKYILPLGTNQILTVNSIINYLGSNTNGNIQITTNTINNFSIGDTVTFKNTNSLPLISGDYIVKGIIDTNSFIINSTPLINSGNNGTVISNLMTYQGKDVGIQVNYWTTSGNSGLTSGSLGFKNAFFGFKNDLSRWAFYNTASISNNIVSGDFGDIQVNELYTNKISSFILDGSISGGSHSIAGSNFQISGGQINNTPIGTNSAQSGKFSNLSNTVSASLSNVTLSSSLNYTFERYTLNSGSPTRNPTTSYAVSLFSVTGPSFTTSSGTMPSNSNSVTDGTFKMLVCSSIGINSEHTIYFGTNKLITPNALGSATKLVFKRQGQSAQLIFDAVTNAGQGAWILLNGGCYIS